MSETKHTPAPWTLEEEGLRQGVEQPSRYVKDAYGEDVARVRGGVPETEANARLVAAAPELLEALEGLLYDFELQMKNPSHHMPFNYQKSKDAIAKAEGR